MRRLTFSLFLLAIVSGLLYLGLMWAQTHKFAYPLDDAWIHLTFARNLALRHELAFLPGQPSGGSTAPLWTFILAPGFLWPFGPEVWTAGLGMGQLAVIGLLTARIMRRLFPDAPQLAVPAAFSIALEWHLNWAAFSGMETLFFIVLLLAMLDGYLAGKPLWWVGLLGGLCIVTRPEGVGLLGLIVAHRIATSMMATGRKPRVTRATIAQFAPPALAFAIPLVPYFWFNLTVSGALVPNTFYAKQAEYVELFASRTIPEHFIHLSAVTFLGAQLLLAPGFLYSVWLIVKERRTEAALLGLWWIMLPAVYALRLPVDYQYARYEMPVIPMLIMLGLWGTWRLWAQLPAGLWERTTRRVWQISFPLLLIIFWVRGALAFSGDVQIMDCMVVQTAQWLAANTQPNEVIALHDIGAAGYLLNDRPLLDLAGLITPDVIPFIRDEPRLMQFILERHAHYLVTSADWHPALIRDPHVEIVRPGNCPIMANQTGVYRVINP